MNGYLKINAVLPSGPQYKRLTDLMLLPSLVKDGLAAGYALKDHGAYNFATGLYSEMMGSPVQGQHGLKFNQTNYINTGILKPESFTFLVVAQKTPGMGFLMGDFVDKTQAADGKEHGTTMSSRGDVYAGVPGGVGLAFGQQSTNVNGEYVLLVYSATKNSATSYSQEYANLQGGRDIFLSRAIPDLVNITDNSVGVGYSVKSSPLGWVADTDVVYACLYSKGFTKAELETWAAQIRSELMQLKGIQI
ncbi:hypothetical protein QR674_05020 [Acinetobacter chinensis]|uniref:Uncharacterized protein n=1 Tax=Acinetobacter chinensis TaxID=2004650 RepID=A0ABU3WD54_9GAMM|nr:hypothetical protein [Acinetobacter chinensis]MDV2468339.1 hypothetical protein [Acinetobacter chinensis]